MYQKHFKSIDSTQLYLKNHINELLHSSEDILISCDEQTSGIGRTGNSWFFNNKSIAMSFTISPHSPVTLTPIEIGLLICHFFKVKYNVDLKLKWPNDVMNIENKKVGGIITHFHSPSVLICGVGINLGTLDNSLVKSPEFFKSGIDSIEINEEFAQEKICFDLFQFIKENRYRQSDEINSEFTNYCCHLNKQVNIYDETHSHFGKFIGINLDGSAIIEENNQTYILNSGSLKIINA